MGHVKKQDHQEVYRGRLTCQSTPYTIAIICDTIMRNKSHVNNYKFQVAIPLSGNLK